MTKRNSLGDSGFLRRVVMLLVMLCTPLACVGRAEVSAVICSEGQRACGGACVDTMSDPGHCGECHSACGAAAECNGGTCMSEDGTVVAAVVTVPGMCAAGQLSCGGSCVAGETKCDDDCVDLQQDATSCGSCGAACRTDQICAAGVCGCASGETACGDTCTDTLSDSLNCGDCGTTCSGGQACAAGSCECPSGELICDSECSDPLTDSENCGACGRACVGGKTCQAGTCECASGMTSCADTCTDTQTDDLNCGACGDACSGGQTCKAGACACPEGQTLCDGMCIDTTQDDANCGACDAACGLGEGCRDSVCSGGALGDDGCSGMARGLEIERISLYQTIELPIVRDGAEVRERNVDVVAGRQTLVRVFANVGENWKTRRLSARLFLANGDQRSVIYTKGPQSFNESSFDEPRSNSYEAARASTFEFMIDGLDADQPDNTVITKDTEYAVEVVECEQVPELQMASPRFPAEGGAEMRAVDVGPMHIRFVPLRSNDVTPPTSEEALAPYLAALRATYPTATIIHSVRDAVGVNDPRDWTRNLDGLRQLRSQDGVDQEVYYYGLLKPTERIRDFCGGGCVAGIGYVTSSSSARYAEQRVSLGLAYPEGGIETMLHEVGHNLGRSHAPCVKGGQIQGVDPNYPYEGALIGIRGYNQITDELVSANRPDIMAYCDAPWFSDYTYGGMLERIRSVNGAMQSFVPDPSRFGDFSILLVEAGKTPAWGFPVSDGVAAGEPETAQILDVHGVVVKSVQVYRTEISDIEAFSIEVPAPQPGWYAVQLQGQAPVMF